jgi:hypothetical protein
VADWITCNHVRIPNAIVFKRFIYNYSINLHRGFDFAVGAGVNADMADVRERGRGVLQKNEKWDGGPAPL